MRTMTYRGDSLTEVLSRVKREVGNNAVILDARDAAIGVEVTIGIDDKQSGVSEDVTTLEPASFTDGESSLVDALRYQGVSSVLEKRLVEACRARRSSGLESDLAAALGRVVPFEPHLPLKNRIIAFVGPTGAGKTTTIAKLAARLRMALGAKVGLVSADTYRVGASHHLQTFAVLMNAPFRAVDPDGNLGDELRKAVDALAGECDLVLIDTPGCGAFDNEKMSEVAGSLKRVESLESLLVIPAPGNAKDMAAVTRRYSVTGYRRIVVTKLDESGHLGPVLDTVAQTGLPLAFLCTGQRVPEDIEPASARRLAWMLSRRMH